MRVSPRPLPSFSVDVAAALGGGAIAWTAAAAALRGASASKETATVAALASALFVCGAVRIATRRAPMKQTPVVFLLGALGPIGMVALATGHSLAVALGCIPALVTAVSCTVIVATAHSARAHGNLDAPERVALASGLAAACFAALLLPLLGWMVVPGLATGVILLAFVIVREGIRSRWLKGVHAGLVPGWSIVHESELDTREAVPNATDHPLADAVLTYVAPSPDPYRAGRPHVVARVHAKPEALVRAPRLRLGKAVVALAATGALSFVGAVATSSSGKTHETPAIDAPKCTMARAYFRERLEANPGVAWATLVTHEQDETIAEGEGVLLVLPRSNALDERSLLEAARAIPCAQKLALRVEHPTFRSFAVKATLTLEPNADRAKVRAEAEQQMHELVDVGSSTTLYDHASIGADDKTFGWRARWVLGRVPGVARANVLVDGVSEAPLGARELPAIGTLELVLRDEGEPL